VLFTRSYVEIGLNDRKNRATEIGATSKAVKETAMYDLQLLQCAVLGRSISIVNCTCMIYSLQLQADHIIDLDQV